MQRIGRATPYVNTRAGIGFYDDQMSDLTRPGEFASRTVAADWATLDGRLTMAAIARRYYLDGRTRVQIAEEFGISRFKVARVLEAAIARGVVKIDISVSETVDTDLSLRVQEKFGLDRALISTPADHRAESVRDALGRTGAELLTDIIGDDDVLGLASGRTIDAVSAHLTRLAGCEALQLTGMSDDLADNPVHVLRRVAELTGAPAYSIFAPLTVGSSETAERLRADPSIRSAFGRFSAVTVAVTSVGSWNPPDSRFFNALSEEDRGALRAKDVMADVAGGLLDSNGNAVSDWDDRVLGIGADGLARVDQVIMVGGGERKADAILAALRSGVVTSLVTDDSVAIRLLDKSATPGRPPRPRVVRL